MKYQVRSKIKGKKYTKWRTVTVEKKAFKKLKKGKKYVFQVRARNAAGPGPTAAKAVKIRR